MNNESAAQRAAQNIDWKSARAGDYLSIEEMEEIIEAEVAAERAQWEAERAEIAKRLRCVMHFFKQNYPAYAREKVEEAYAALATPDTTSEEK